MGTEAQIEYWETSATHDWETAQSLYQSGKYDWCLFIAHLVLEKRLKAAYIKKTQLPAPFSHQLHLLAKQANITLSVEQEEFLRKVNEFNIEARYPDHKLSFYKLCTAKFAKEYLSKIEDFIKWLPNNI